MEIITQLSAGEGNPKFPSRIGDGIKVTVEFPFREDFYELVQQIHDQAFRVELSNKESYSCVLNQGGTPIAMIFPDANVSPPIVSMKLLVYCDMENIVDIKKSDLIKLII